MSSHVASRVDRARTLPQVEPVLDVGRRPGTRRRPDRVRGRPARPLFATPGIALGPAAVPATDYTDVIRRVEGRVPRTAPATLARHGTRPRPQRDRRCRWRWCPRAERSCSSSRTRPRSSISNGMVFHSERLVIEAPSVVRLRRYVRVPYRPHAPLTRRAVFARDAWTCQYCGARAENLDHVVPRSRGGLHVWENVVAACRRCNAKKEDRTPVGGRLPPRAPAVRAARRVPSHARTASSRAGRPSSCRLAAGPAPSAPHTTPPGRHRVPSFRIARTHVHVDAVECQVA